MGNRTSVKQDDKAVAPERIPIQELHEAGTGLSRHSRNSRRSQRSGRQTPHPLLEERSPQSPNFSQRRSERESGRRRRSSANSNRYDGLGDINIVTATQRRRGEGRGSQRTNSVLSLVKNNAEILIDVNKPAASFEEDLPPPPPPPPVGEEEESIVYRQARAKLTKDDITFIDYTVVPLLLRSNLEYTAADKFGRMLKLKYKRPDIDKLLGTPFALFEALQTEGILVSEDFKFQIIEDKFWNNGKQNNPKDRKSFVYYKETPTNLTRASKRSARSSYRERASMRREFEQEQATLTRRESPEEMIDIEKTILQIDKEIRQEEEATLMSAL